MEAVGQRTIKLQLKTSTSQRRRSIGSRECGAHKNTHKENSGAATRKQNACVVGGHSVF